MAGIALFVKAFHVLLSTAVPAIVFALAGGWWQMILIEIVFVVANQIDNHGLTPMVPSKSTKLRPTVVVRAALGGCAAGGIVGAVVAISVEAFLKAMYVRYYPFSTFDRGVRGVRAGRRVGRDALSGAEVQSPVRGRGFECGSDAGA